MNNTIGSRIKELRKKQNMSVDQLAKLVGKSRATIYRYENGEIENAPYNVLIPFAEVLNTTPTYLLGLENMDLNELRISHNKEIDEVASETHIDVSLLKQYENGEKAIPFDVIERLADYYGTSVDTIKGMVFMNRGDEPMYDTSNRISATAKRWQDEVGETRFSDDEMTQLINFAKYLISQRKDK